MTAPDPWNHVTALHSTITRLKILLAEIKVKSLRQANLFTMAEHPADKSRKVDVEPMASSEDSIAHGTVMDADDDLLRHIGYKQVRQALPFATRRSADASRNFGANSPECLRFPMLSPLWESWAQVGAFWIQAVDFHADAFRVPASWSSPLAAGGPATAIWCWFSGSFFALCIALSSEHDHPNGRRTD